MRAARSRAAETRARHQHDRAETRERGPHPECRDRPAEDRRAEHRAERVEAHDIAVGEAAALHHRLVHRLLRDDEQHARAGAEQHPVAERELREARRRRGEHQPQPTGEAARERERHRREPSVELRREVHAHRERDGGQAEHEAHLRARGTEQRLHRLEEHAEGVERAERQVDDGRGEECGGAAVGWAHGIRINATGPGRGATTRWSMVGSCGCGGWVSAWEYRVTRTWYSF